MVMLRALIQAASVGRQALRQLALHVDAGQRALDQCRAAHTECLCRAARAGCQAARAACWCRAARARCQCRAARAWCRDDLAAHTRIHWLPLQRTKWDITARQPMAAPLLLLRSALAVLTIYELGNSRVQQHLPWHRAGRARNIVLYWKHCISRKRHLENILPTILFKMPTILHAILFTIKIILFTRTTLLFTSLLLCIVTM